LKYMLKSKQEDCKFKADLKIKLDGIALEPVTKLCKLLRPN